MSEYLREFTTRTTPQGEALPGRDQVQNSDGAFVFAVDDWTRLERFLILGSEGGSYYARESKLTRENAQGVLRCIKSDGVQTVERIANVSMEGRAPKNDPAIFALALAASLGDGATRKAALKAIPMICRTGTHLFTFASLIEQHRGWGRGLRKAVAAWYERDDVDGVAYQAVKYRSRGDWTHSDLLRLAHPKDITPEHASLYDWICGREPESKPEIVVAFEKAQAARNAKETAALIREYPSLPREALQTDHLNEAIVWEALLEQGMPMTAMLRNLATMTRMGVLDPMSDGASIVTAQLTDEGRLRASRVHPLAVLVALTTYQRGYGVRSAQTWTPTREIIDALDAAFYAAFGNVEPCGKRTMLSLDISGSMTYGEIAGMPGITPAVGAAAMSMITAASESRYVINGFGRSLVELDISPRQRLNDIVRRVFSMNFGSTDCALPMAHALKNHMEIDTFVVYTDSETNHYGSVQPVSALREYRRLTGIPAKLVVVGMVSNGFTIADPDDAGMLDIVGFDTAAPQVISDFSKS